MILFVWYVLKQILKKTSDIETVIALKLEFKKNVLINNI